MDSKELKDLAVESLKSIGQEITSKRDLEMARDYAEMALEDASHLQSLSDDIYHLQKEVSELNRQIIKDRELIASLVSAFTEIIKDHEL